MKNPKIKLWLFYGVSLLLIALALFLSAGTIDYWRAWVYLVVTAATCIPLIAYVTKDPRLLESRANLGPAAEQRPVQKIIVWGLILPEIAAFLIPGFDRRFGWSRMPWWLSLAGDILIIAAMWMVLRVFRENSFGSATVEVAEGQKVISTGPYAIVRNPMYASAALYFIGMCFALGSYWTFMPCALLILGLVWRLFDEEKFLAQNLPGYEEYCAKVRWHLVPGIF